jgi:hypothetical protein
MREIRKIPVRRSGISPMAKYELFPNRQLPRNSLILVQIESRKGYFLAVPPFLFGNWEPHNYDREEPTFQYDYWWRKPAVLPVVLRKVAAVGCADHPKSGKLI